MRKALRWSCGLLITQLFLPACSSRQNDRIILKDIPETRAITHSTALSIRIPNCPPAGVALMQPSHPGTGHHKVTLSWNASAVASGQGNNVVGYCLYRSKKPDAAKKNPTCSSCEQVNLVPVAGISCVDDLVEDSATYYYVVTAINLAGKISPASNQTTVPIPPGNLVKPAPAGLTPPSCRNTPVPHKE